MLKKLISPISYQFIKWYRDNYISHTSISGNNGKETIENHVLSTMVISNIINSNYPCLISRFGNVELNATLNYKKKQPLSLIRTIFPFWADDCTIKRMQSNAGFFPINHKSLSRFSDLIYTITPEIDILGVWNGLENLMPLSNKCQLIQLQYLEPFWSSEPWTANLKGRKVLVVHPFAESIKKQYAKRNLLFENKDILPEFESLTVIKAVQSIGGETNGFNTWFDALKYMEDEIDKVDYEIALIGCGAYGMPLAAHCKQMGKKAIHLGGALQLLFGIRGNRWETEQKIYTQFMNEYWVRPLDSEKPDSAQNVENACYW